MTDVAYFSGDKIFKITSNKNKNDHIILNGLIKPKINIRPGEWQR
jgi:hypothetical protein